MSKKELQEETYKLWAAHADMEEKIIELQNKVNEVEEPSERERWTQEKGSWHLMLSESTFIATSHIGDMFSVVKHSTFPYDEPHHLGRYKTKEYAEMARACLIHLLHELKKCEETHTVEEIYSLIVSPCNGKGIIKQIEEGTYE